MISLAGNEPFIEDIVSKLVALCCRKGYIDRHSLKPLAEFDHELRKITLYLMLNAEVSFKYDLSRDHTISHLLKTLPEMPKCLLYACIWGLSLERYFFECIAFAPIWFTYQFIGEVVDSLKYADPYETLDRVDQLVCAIYMNVARSDFRQMPTVDQKIILSKYYDVTMDLLRHFFAPDAEKFDKWTTNKYRKYMGFVMKHNLHMILQCFDVFQHRPILKSDPIECDVYNLMREREPPIDDHRHDYSGAVRDTLHRMNTTLLNSLQYNVMQVDCNTFMYWVEVDIDDDYTLQRTIGEAAFKAQQLISGNECFEHNVSEQLKSISIKPLTVQEIIAQSTIGEMIEKLEKLVDSNDANIGLWIDWFIDRGELVLGNTECLETLELHVQSLTVAQVKRLILFASDASAGGDEEEYDGPAVDEKLIEICLGSFDHLRSDQIFELIQYSIDKQKHFNYLQLDNFDQFLIEVFNKSTFAQNRMAYLKLLMQNPHLFYNKLFEEALTTEAQMEHMLSIVGASINIFRNYLDTQLKQLITSDRASSTESQMLPKLLSQLFFLDVIEPSKFIIDILYKKYLIDALKAKNNERVCLIMTTFVLIGNRCKFEGICPPLLVMCAQVLELYRWNLITFNDQSVAIVCKTIELINEILKKYLPNAAATEKSWIVSKIAAYGQLTRYYFQKLSLSIDETPKVFDEFIWPSNKQATDKSHCVKFLCEYVVRCTSKEINWLAKSNQLLPHFWEAFHLITTIVSRSKNAPELNCLKYCSNTFISIFDVRTTRELCNFYKKNLD